MKRVPRQFALMLVVVTLLVGCDSPGASETEADASDTAYDDASDADGSIMDAADTGTSPDEWPEDVHSRSVVELPAAVESVEAPAECEEFAPFDIPFVLPLSRFEVDAVEESVWVWGRDHYLTGYVRSGPNEAREVAFLSEQLGPPRIFPLSVDERGARRFFHRDMLYTRDGDATFEYHPIWFTSPEQSASWVLAVTPADRAILYESGSMNLWSCPLACPQPERISSVTTNCPLADNCARLTSLPEPENERAVGTFFHDDDELYWLGERGVWKTALRPDGDSELVLQTEVRSFATNGTWIAWVDLDGDAYLAHRDGETRFRLATDLTEPRFEPTNSLVWTTAEADVLRVEGNWIWWWDGESIRGFDLERRANLDAAWTTELPSRPLGFELGACSSYTLFEDRVLVRPLVVVPD